MRAHEQPTNQVGSPKEVRGLAACMSGLVLCTTREGFRAALLFALSNAALELTSLMQKVIV
jgi:hypothetical protein